MEPDKIVPSEVIGFSYFSYSNWSILDLCVVPNEILNCELSKDEIFASPKNNIKPIEKIDEKNVAKIISTKSNITI
jgi:hypothetical protein